MSLSFTYTIMPDYGGAYGWVNRYGTDTLGPNPADHAGWGEVTMGSLTDSMKTSQLGRLTKRGHDVKIVVGPVRRRAGNVELQFA